MNDFDQILRDYMSFSGSKRGVLVFLPTEDSLDFIVKFHFCCLGKVDKCFVTSLFPKEMLARLTSLSLTPCEVIITAFTNTSMPYVRTGESIRIMLCSILDGISIFS